MSLINDALKRAQEAQRKDSPAYIVSPMRPNADPRQWRHPHQADASNANLSWIMPVVIVLLVLVAVFFIGNGDGQTHGKSDCCRARNFHAVSNG